MTDNLNLCVIQGYKNNEETQSKIIDVYSKMLNEIDDQIVHTRWEIPLPPFCSISDDDYLNKHNQWMETVNEYHHKLDQMELEIGAVFERVKKALSHEDYKKFLRRNKTKIKNADERIEKYVTRRECIRNGLSGVSIRRKDDESEKLTFHPKSKWYSGSAFGYIEYFDENTLLEQLSRLLKDYHLERDNIERIETMMSELENSISQMEVSNEHTV